MTVVRVGGLDCAFANLGIAVANVDVDTHAIDVRLIKLLHTERDNDKQVRRNSDDLKRSQELNVALTTTQLAVDFFMAEIPTGAQSARAAFGFGIAVGALGGLVKPLIQVQPREVKRVVTGRNSASKEEVIDWAMMLCPDLPWHMHKFKGALIPTSTNEHMADAIAIIHAGVKTNEFKQACALYRAVNVTKLAA